MNNHTYFNERKSQLILEYIAENKRAACGRKLVVYSLYTLLVIRLALVIFEIPTFIILHSYLNILYIFLLIPYAIILYLISKGAKGFTYVILVSATFRLIIYFGIIAKSLPESTLTNVYSFVFLGVMLLQFFISLFLLVSFDCDTYFSAVQRITIKVHGEELLAQKNK